MVYRTSIGCHTSAGVRAPTSWCFWGCPNCCCITMNSARSRRMLGLPKSLRMLVLLIIVFQQALAQHQQHQDSHHRPASYSASTSSTSYSSSTQHYNSYHYERHHYSTLTDVWLCLAMALGWTIWMLSSLVKSDLLKYHQDSVLVKGHVLSVSRDVDSLGTGIPTYKAVIDYMLTDKCQVIQVRKHFETQSLLEEGFANVELLVLPAEPTHSVLREDWEKEVEESVLDQRDAVVRPVFCKRVSVALAVVLVFASVTGSIQVVTLMDPHTQWQGWLSVCAGVTILLPTAMMLHRCIQAIQRSVGPEQAGVIVKGNHTEEQACCEDLDALDAGAVCEDDPDSAVLMSGASYKMQTTYDYYVSLPKSNRETSSLTIEDIRTPPQLDGPGREKSGDDSASTVSSLSMQRSEGSSWSGKSRVT